MTDKSEIHARVVKVVAEVLKKDPGSVTAKSRFVEDLGADSIDMFTLVTQLEEEFAETIAETDAEKLATVGAAVDYIVERARTAAPTPAS